MKKLILMLVLLISANAYSQNCFFTTNISGTTAVAFNANTFFPPNLYHYEWDFGDGTISTGFNVTHTYNSIGLFLACCNYYDGNNNHVCSSCDTINIGSSNCFFTTQINGLAATFFPQPGTANTTISWNFGGPGSASPVNPDIFVYDSAGVYNVCMTVTDIATGNIVCTYCQVITVGGTPGNCFFTLVRDPADTNTAIVTAVPSYPNTTFAWTFGDGTNATGSTLSHTYTTAGSYTICMNEIDSAGNILCTSCSGFLVGVNPVCSFTAVIDTMIPLSVTLYPSGSLISTYVFDYGDGTTGSSINHTYALAGTYNVCMTQYNMNGTNCTSCDTITVTGNSTGNCAFVYSMAPISTYNTFNFSAVTVSGNVIWDFGDGSPSDTGITAYHIYSAPGNYNVCMTQTSVGPLTVLCTSCQWIQVSAPPGNCVITHTPGSPNTTIPDVFSIQPSSILSTIVWDFGDGSPFTTSPTATHTFSTPGTYMVCVTETDPNGTIICQSCLSVTIGVVGCQASFIPTSLGMTSYFIDMSTNPGPQVMYAWDFGDGSTSNVRFPQHTYANIGTYPVCLTVSGGGCIDQFCSSVVADTNVIINPVGCQAFFALVQLSAYQVTVVNLSSGLNLNFAWDFGDGSTDSSAFPSHVYNNTGAYNLCLTISDNNGCSDNYCYTLTVDTLGNIFRSTSPVGFTLNVVAPSELVGVNEIQNVTPVSTYPNPASSELTISIPSNSKSMESFRIFSIEGKEVLAGKLESFSQKINVQNLSSGTYLLEVTLTNGERSFQSVIRN